VTGLHRPWPLHVKRRAIALSISALAVLATTVLFDPDSTPTRSAVPLSIELRKTLAEAEERYGPSSEAVADALEALGIGLMNESPRQFDEIEALARRALMIRETLFGPDSPRVADSLEQLSFAIWEESNATGDLPRGERPLIERALAIRERAAPVDEHAIARDLHFLSEDLRVFGEIGGALQLRERLDPLLRRLCSEDPDCIAVHLTCLAQLQDMTGDFARAVQNAKRAVAIREQVLPLSDPRTAASLNALGDLLLKGNDLSGAEQAFRRAVTISESQPTPDPGAVARAREHLGEALQKRGEWAGARREFERTLALRLRCYGADHVLVARALERLGAVERLLGKEDQARSHLVAAHAIFAKAPPVTRPEFATSLRELALLDWSQGEDAAALDEALRVESISREYFQFASGGVSEREALAQARARPRGDDLAMSAALALAERGRLSEEQGDRLFDEVIRSRALVLDVLASRHRVLALHPDARTTTLVDELLRARHLASRETLSAAAAETAERALAERSLEFREELARQRTGFGAVHQALPPDTALVSFVLYVEAPREPAGRGVARYAAFVLRAGASSPRVFSLAPASRIDAAVAAWRDSVFRDPRLQRASDPVAAYLRVGGDLAEEIWRPFESEVRGAAHVVVTRDGALQRVSFATLPTPNAEYLVASGPTIAYVGAERDLVPAATSPYPLRRLLAIGDPAFGETGGAFDPLPVARAEVAEIASRWPSRDETIVLTGGAADEAVVKRLAPSCGVLHLATHAFDDTAACESGGGNPLRCTGLALAGANRALASSQTGTGDDGVLTADEIALLDLHGVEWAVLSACASGGGTIEPGEGIVGLERAFRIAGARNVVASLWPVEDDATRSWMRELYAARRAGASTAESVRHAAVALLERQRRSGGTTHPYAWGGFIAVGDGR